MTGFGLEGLKFDSQQRSGFLSKALFKGRFCPPPPASLSFSVPFLENKTAEELN
jgi:hypothetical protein